MEYLNKVLELTTLAMAYQNEGIGDSFFHYSGHTEQFDIILYKGKWTGSDDDKTERVTIYLQGQLFNYKKYLKTVIWLQDCLLKKDLLNSNCIYEKEEQVLMNLISQ
jgi:hypothetical protein